MHQDATWYGCWPQPRGLCVRWRPRWRLICETQSSLPNKGGGTSPPPNFRPISVAAKWLACIKMSLGMELGLGPGDFVLDGDLAPPQKGGGAPIFGPFLLSPNGWMHHNATRYGGRPQPRRVCVRWGPSRLPKRGAEPPPEF